MVKIALFDLNHMTRGVHTNTVPLGLGLISQYLKKGLQSIPDIKMFKDSNKALSVLGGWIPDVLGLSQYCWNSELNLYFARLVKEANPACIVVAGGPNLNSSSSLRTKFLSKDNYIDICVSYDGEIPFLEIVKRLICGEIPSEIRKKQVAGSYALHPETKEFVESLESAPRLKSLDIFGSPYADGVFDEFLDDGFHPFIQTHRGCPFKCSFCHTSDQYYSRMLFLSPDIFRRDMEYLGKRFAGQDNVVLYLANTNMSLFREDFEIARIIREIQDKYNWPRIINVNSGKNPQKLLEMLSVIRFQPAIALQTLTPAVLKNINRINIPLEEFVSFQHDVLRQTGETSATELILCLPGETKATFLETVRRVINSGVQNVVIYTLMNLKGTPLSSEENVQKYGYVIRHRVVPRQFSIVQGRKVLDTEEVIVGTSTMSFEEYLEMRGLCFSITSFFNSVELVPLKELLDQYQVDLADWVLGVHRRVSEFPDVIRYYHDFIRETKAELFHSREELVVFFEKEKNWKALCDGRLGDNLLRKYKQLVLSCCFPNVLELAFSEAEKRLSVRLVSPVTSRILADMRLFLMTRDVQDIFTGTASTEDRRVTLRFDIPEWFASSDRSALPEKFSGKFLYDIKYAANVKKKAREFASMNKDLELSLQILYRDGNIRDFWPEWVRVSEK
jgi:radical SAM superfamily enzyme YgiQ (UPF0313 family)